jgi:hypothetical protein
MKIDGRRAVERSTDHMQQGKVSTWLAVVLAVCLVGAGALVGLVATGGLPGLFAVNSESRSSQVVNSITREQQVVLLSLAIQGIEEKKQNREFVPGFVVPGSERAVFMMYSFKAKIGLEGRDVKVSPKGDNAFLVIVPDFVFIGHSDEQFRLAAQENGLLSWATTPEIDREEMVNTILNDGAQRTYIDSNREILQSQTKVFYTNIIHGIDPNIELTFDFGS